MDKVQPFMRVRFILCWMVQAWVEDFIAGQLPLYLGTPRAVLLLDMPGTVDMNK